MTRSLLSNKLSQLRFDRDVLVEEARRNETLRMFTDVSPEYAIVRHRIIEEISKTITDILGE